MNPQFPVKTFHHGQVSCLLHVAVPPLLALVAGHGAAACMLPTSRSGLSIAHWQVFEFLGTVWHPCIAMFQWWSSNIGHTVIKYRVVSWDSVILIPAWICRKLLDPAQRGSRVNHPPPPPIYQKAQSSPSRHWTSHCQAAFVKQLHAHSVWPA